MKTYSLLALLVALGVACSQPPAGRGAGEVQTSPQSNVSFKVEKVVGGLEVPWSIVWAPDGRMIFTERPGRLRVMEKGWATEEDLKAIDKEVRDIVADSADFAQADPEPDVSELYTDILL